MCAMYCVQCKSTAIKSRTNYTHGKNKKSAVTSFVCKKCGSTEVANNAPTFNRRRR